MRLGMGISPARRLGYRVAAVLTVGISGLGLASCAAETASPQAISLTGAPSPNDAFAEAPEGQVSPSESLSPTPAQPIAVPGPNAPTPTKQAYVLGDSLTYKAKAFMDQAMSVQGWVTNPATDSRIGRSVEEGLSILADQPDLPETVLVALGTNNWTASASEAAAWVRKARSLIGPDRRLIWVNVQLDGERYQTYLTVNEGLLAGARADNSALRRSGDSGRTYIADWARFSTDNRIRHNHDGVHYKAGGYRQRMAFYAGVLANVPPYDGYLVQR